MALIEWKDEFRLGIPGVDYEHEQLIALINQVHDEMLEDDSRDRIAYFLGDLYANISAHFALEEATMREMGYGEYPAHKADHERLLDEIREIMDTHEDDGYFEAEERFAERLRQWFTVHFREMDAKLHALRG
jgi:hemerythrin-like metal-binding protein